MKTKSVTSAEKAFLKKLGARIRRLRLEKGWTLEETEEHGWPDWTHMQQVETGKNITVVTLRRIAKMYKVSPADLWKDL